MTNISRSKKLIIRTLLTFLFILQISCQKEELNRLDVASNIHSEHIEDDLELDNQFSTLDRGSCLRANSSQIAQVNSGNEKRLKFLAECRAQTNSSLWCDQLARPNPSSHAIFDCTYSAEQSHYLIHPTEATWSYAITAVKLIKELEQKNIKACTIYNWWRPEPYNANVGGASGRHPYGTSIDVRFCTKLDQAKAHKELCNMRKKGRLRALGYYSSTALHLGIGDRVANTWGKSCP